MSLLIYVPEVSSQYPVDDILVEAGLGGLCSTTDFPAQKPLLRDVATGPGGRTGVVIGYADSPNHVGYFVERQQWTESELVVTRPPGSRAPTDKKLTVWFGRQAGHVCSPRLLRRHTEYTSVDVKLDDEQLWELPLVKELPKDLRYRGETLIQEVRPPFRQQFTIGVAIYKELIALNNGTQPESPLGVGSAWRFVAAGLAMNYAVTNEVVDYLGLLRTEKTLMSAAGASVEYPAMLEWNRQMAEEPAAAVV